MAIFFKDRSHTWKLSCSLRGEGEEEKKTPQF
jgi:hypothetical protein